jgi:hypothetical protein
MSSAEPSLEQLAAQDIDELDVANLARLAELYDTLDPVPDGLVDRVQFGITLDALHAEIAQLQRTADLVGVRSDTAVAVTFTSENLSIMVTITPTSADRVRIDGWLAPGAPATVELRQREGVVTERADDEGRFVFSEVNRGLAQFTVRLRDGDGGRPVITPSIEL